jgi:hypothetical protein
MKEAPVDEYAGRQHVGADPAPAAQRDRADDAGG